MDEIKFTQEIKNSVTNRYLKIYDLNSLSGLYNFLKENDLYEKFKYTIADFIKSFVEGKANDYFHKNLNLFEKMGFLSNKKYLQHQKNMGLLNGFTSLAAMTVIDLAPQIIDLIRTKIRNQKYIEFVVGWLAYINQKQSLILKGRIVKFYDSLGAKFELDEFNNIFDKYSTGNVNDLPALSGLTKEEKYKLFNYILSASDIEDKFVSERIKQFGNEYLAFKILEVEEIMNSVEDNLEYNSDVSSITGFSLLTSSFQSIIGNYDKAKEFAIYNFDNDPFAKIRIKRKEEILKAGKDITPIVMAGFTFYAGPVGDAILVAATPIIHRLLNDEINIDKTINIHSALKKVMDELKKEQELKKSK